MPGTRKKSRTIVLPLLAVLAIAIIWYLLVPRAQEPTYKDKPLSAWLKGYDSQNKMAGPEWQEADEAIRHTGTNAIPTLLRMLRSKDSAFTLTVIDLMDRQRIVKNPFTRATELNNRAFYGLQRLGIDATNAIPDLLAIFNQNISNFSAGRAALVLGSMGPAAKGAVPSLLSAAKNPNSDMRGLALYVLGEICVEPETVVPVLIAALQDPEASVRRSAIHSLIFYEKSAKPAIPALKHLVNDPDYEVRRSALRALDVIDSAAAKKARADEYKR